MRVPRDALTFDFAIIVERNDRKRVQINGVPIKGDDFDTYARWIQRHLIRAKVCPFCASPFQVLGCYSSAYSDEVELFTVYDPEQRVWDHEAMLWTCPTCQAWQWYSGGTIEHSPHGDLLELTAALSKVRAFEPEWPDGCYHELVQHLRRNPSRWHDISPSALERLVAAVYRANFHPCEVFHVGKSHDGGVDVVFVDSANKQWLIQVKRRIRIAAREGVSTLRNLLGAMVLNGTPRGIVVSTADQFTYRALDAVNRASTVGMEIQLVDLGKLKKLVGAVLPRDPCLSFIEEVFPELADQFVSRVFQLRQEEVQLKLF